MKWLATIKSWWLRKTAQDNPALRPRALFNREAIFAEVDASNRRMSKMSREERLQLYVRGLEIIYPEGWQTCVECHAIYSAKQDACTRCGNLHKICAHCNSGVLQPTERARVLHCPLCHNDTYIKPTEKELMALVDIARRS